MNNGNMAEVDWVFPRMRRCRRRHIASLGRCWNCAATGDQLHHVREVAGSACLMERWCNLE